MIYYRNSVGVIKMNKNQQIDPQTLELMYNEVKVRLELRITSIKTIENKAHSIIGFVGVITGLGITCGNFLISKAGVSFSDFEKGTIFSIYIVGMASFLLSVCFAFLAYKIESYRLDPDPKKLLEKYFYYPYTKVLSQLLDNFAISHIDNGKILLRKAKYVKYSLLFFVVGLCFVFLFMISYFIIQW